MNGQNIWGDLRQRTLAPLDGSLPEFELTAVEGIAASHSTLRITPEKHHVVIHLTDSLRIIQANFSHGPSTLSGPVNGEVWVIPAGSEFQAELNGGTTSFCDIQFAASNASYSHIALTATLGGKDDFLYELINTLFKMMNHGKLAYPKSFRSLGPVLFWHIVDRYQWTENHCNDNSQNLPINTKDTLIEFIEDNLTGSITVETLAGISGQGVQAFLRQFYDSFGITPAQYIARAKIERAKSLLSQSRCAVDDIAVRCGFQSSGFFSSSFTKQVGIAPLTYRQVHR
jgi:AraC-like DNA-binding protein